MNKGAIFPLFYLPPIEYFHHLAEYKENILIEKFEHFPKQTYRNRASIQTPQGKLNLTIPVVKGSKVHTKIKDVKISCDFNWQRLHWMTLQTSYRSSAYFEFYEDELAPFYHQKWDFLFDYNLDLLRLLFKFLKLSPQIAFTESYESEYPDLTDFRNAISSKSASSYQQKPYFQVFEERNGFIANLSVIDLLFSQGPNSLKYV